MIPITANLASSESMTESLSSSFGVELIGETNELKMQAPIAIPTGASDENPALHVPFLSFLWKSFSWRWQVREGLKIRNREGLKQSEAEEDEDGAVSKRGIICSEKVAST